MQALAGAESNQVAGQGRPDSARVAGESGTGRSGEGRVSMMSPLWGVRCHARLGGVRQRLMDDASARQRQGFW